MLSGLAKMWQLLSTLNPTNDRTAFDIRREVFVATQ